MHVNLGFSFFVPDTLLLERWVDSRTDLGQSDRETNLYPRWLSLLLFNTLHTELSGFWEGRN